MYTSALSPSSLSNKHVPAYILAGGKSTRFQSDKTLVIKEGRPLLLFLIESLQRLGHDVHVVADRPDRYESLGINCLVDAVADCGPIGGLMTSVEHRRATVADSWLLVISCDLWVWNNEWFRQLAQVVEANLDKPSSQDFRSVQYCIDKRESENDKGSYKPSPLPGLYHTSASNTVASQIATGQYALKAIPLGQQYVRAGDNPSLYGFNTPEELNRLRSSN